MLSVDPSHPGRDLTVTTWAELVAVLRDQHEVLGVSLARLPQLAGPALEDEFLQARRRLAVHVQVEAELLLPRLAVPTPPEPVVSRIDVVRAERAATGSRDFDLAVAALLAAHLRHAEVQEQATFPELSGELAGPERAVAGTAVSLWLGEGEAYLGHVFDDMLATAREQLLAAPEPGHAPPVGV